MIPIGSHPAWHPVFETLAYAGGFAVFRSDRARQGDVLAEPQRWTILAAAAVGALAGSRILGIAEQWPTVLAAVHSGHLFALLISPGGKTIVGGLLGGWLGVELVKRITDIRRRTGDLFVLPLCIGIAIGRIGCFVAGLADDTYGKPTGLPWAVNFGDGIGRHPTQLYEILFLLALAFVLSHPMALREGARFGIFLGSYLGWRFLYRLPQAATAAWGVEPHPVGLPGRNRISRSGLAARFRCTPVTPSWKLNAPRPSLGAQWLVAPLFSFSRPSEVTAVQAPWRNLKGPARSLAISATILLVASALGGIEAGMMIILGPARDVLIKPFVLLGYLEACAMFFSLIAIVISIVCLIFYQPYLYIRERIFIYRARHAAQVSDEHTWFEEPRPALATPVHNPEEDGAPD